MSPFCTQLVPGPKRDVPLETALPDAFFEEAGGTSFDPRTIDFLDALSASLLRSTRMREFPELAALGFWLRRANVTRMVEDHRKTLPSSEVPVPRGVAFHVAPSNVDSIFLYSWALSMLAGNANVVRVPQRGEQIEHLLDHVRTLLEMEIHQPIALRNRLLAYGHDDEMNRRLSARADVRLVWGGDETVRHFKALPAKLTTKDLVFADKFSYAAIDAGGYRALDPPAAERLAHDFFNDAYWFGQMACSSPRIVFFVGADGDCEAASALFWERLKREIARSGVAEPAAAAVNKQVWTYESAIAARDEAPFRVVSASAGAPAVVRVSAADSRLLGGGCGDGAFWEVWAERLDALRDVVRAKDQTLTYWGFSKDELRRWIESLAGRGVDRVVPVGQALNFTPVWDGYSLLTELTRRVTLL